ncbi:50S ribosomal protein L11, partial [Striga asiatica]
MNLGQQLQNKQPKSDEQIEDGASIISSIKFSTTGLREPSISPTYSKFFCEISPILKDREILDRLNFFRNFFNRTRERVPGSPCSTDISDSHSLEGRQARTRKPKLTKPWDIEFGPKLVLIAPAHALKCRARNMGLFVPDALMNSQIHEEWEFGREVAEKRLTDINHLQIQAHEVTKLVWIGPPVNQWPNVFFPELIK